MTKRRNLRLSSMQWSQIQRFLTYRTQVVKIGNNIFSPQTRNIGAPPESFASLPPTLITAYPRSSIIIEHFADTLVVGLILWDSLFRRAGDAVIVM